MEHIGNTPTTVFAKVEHLSSQGLAFAVEHGIALIVFHIFPNDATCKVHIIIKTRLLCQHIHIVG